MTARQCVYYPFDIVSCLYTDFDGKTTPGLFVVGYTEYLDKDNETSSTLIGFKITKDSKRPNKYRVGITREQCPSLVYDSYVYTNKPFSLASSHCKYLTSLPVGLRVEFVVKLHECNSVMAKQATKYIGGKYD